MPRNSKVRTFTYQPTDEEQAIKIIVSEYGSGSVFVHIADPAELTVTISYNEGEVWGAQ